MKNVVISCFLFCFACVAKADEIRIVDVDNNFIDYRIHWLGGASSDGGIKFKWRVVGFDGVDWICGVYKHESGSNLRRNRKAIRGMWIRLGSNTGKSVINDLTYFAKINTASSLGSAKARCKSTGVRSNYNKYWIGTDGETIN